MWNFAQNASNENFNNLLSFLVYTNILKINSARKYKFRNEICTNILSNLCKKNYLKSISIFKIICYFIYFCSVFTQRKCPSTHYTLEYWLHVVSGMTSYICRTMSKQRAEIAKSTIFGPPWIAHFYLFWTKTSDSHLDEHFITYNERKQLMTPGL